MPLYEYQCSDCGDNFEKMLRFSEIDQNPSCPSCQSTKTKKKISSFAALGGSLNGSDFSSSSSCGSSGGFT
jgi:putative FmdB family regulatory protein